MLSWENTVFPTSSRCPKTIDRIPAQFYFLRDFAFSDDKASFTQEIKLPLYFQLPVAYEKENLLVLTTSENLKLT